MNDYLNRISIAEFLKNDTLPPVVLCIGTDRVIGDALGPLVGSALIERFDLPCYVYGTLRRPVTALNLTAAARFITRRHVGQKVIAVDAGLGNPTDVGKIRVSEGGLRPGLAVGKLLPEVGDFSVTATVADSRKENALSLVRIGFVSELALSIAEYLSKEIDKLIPPVSSVRYNNIVSY